MPIILSEKAAKLVHQAMTESGLDTNRHVLDVQVRDSGITLGFGFDVPGAERQFDVLVCPCQDDLFIDVHENKGNIGLIFTEHNGYYKSSD